MGQAPMGAGTEDLRGLEDHKASIAAVQAQRRVAAEISMLVLRSLILVSGGSVVGVLTFVGNVWIREPAVGHRMAEGMLFAVASFTLALIFGLLAAMVGYLSSLRYARALMPRMKPGLAHLARRAERTRNMAIACGVACLVLIGAGATAAICALAGAL